MVALGAAAGARQPSGCDGPFVPGTGVAGGSRLVSGIGCNALEGGVCSTADSASALTTSPDDSAPADRTEPLRTFDRQLAQSPVKTGPHSSYGVAHIVQPAPAATKAIRNQPSKVRDIEDSLSPYLGAYWNDGSASFPISSSPPDLWCRRPACPSRLQHVGQPRRLHHNRPQTRRRARFPQIPIFCSKHTDASVYSAEVLSQPATFSRESRQQSHSRNEKSRISWEIRLLRHKEGIRDQQGRSQSLPYMHPFTRLFASGTNAGRNSSPSQGKLGLRSWGSWRSRGSRRSSLRSGWRGRRGCRSCGGCRGCGAAASRRGAGRRAASRSTAGPAAEQVAPPRGAASRGAGRGTGSRSGARSAAGLSAAGPAALEQPATMRCAASRSAGRGAGRRSASRGAGRRSAGRRSGAGSACLGRSTRRRRAATLSRAASSAAVEQVATMRGTASRRGAGRSTRCRSRSAGSRSAGRRAASLGMVAEDAGLRRHGDAQHHQQGGGANHTRSLHFKILQLTGTVA